MGRKRNYGGSGSVTPGEGDSLLQRTVTLSSADILALHTTAFQLVPAPGLGRCLVPVLVVGRLKFGGTAYAAGSNVDCSVGPLANGHSILAFGAGFIQFGADGISERENLGLGTPEAVAAQFENQDLELKATGAAFTTGNGSLEVTIFYSVAIVG